MNMAIHERLIMIVVIISFTHSAYSAFVGNLKVTIVTSYIISFLFLYCIMCSRSLGDLLH